MPLRPAPPLFRQELLDDCTDRPEKSQLSMVRCLLQFTPEVVLDALGQREVCRVAARPDVWAFQSEVLWDVLRMIHAGLQRPRRLLRQARRQRMTQADLPDDFPPEHLPCLHRIAVPRMR